MAVDRVATHKLMADDDYVAMTLGRHAAPKRCRL
jgi:hypothetical protein